MPKIAILQYKPIKGEASQNLAALLDFCTQAAKQGARLIHLPEMCLNGYLWDSPEAIEPYLEEKEGPSFQILASFAKEQGVYLAYGYAEKEGIYRYNSQNLINPEGDLAGHYRKTFLFEADTTWASPGNRGFQIIPTEFGTIGLGICMDLNFDEFVHHHAEHQTDILCIAVNWLEQGGSILPYWAMRLFPITKNVLIANTHGFEDEIEFCGQSSILQNHHFLVTAPKTGDYLLVQSI